MLSLDGLLLGSHGVNSPEGGPQAAGDTHVVS